MTNPHTAADREAVVARLRVEFGPEATDSIIREAERLAVSTVYPFEHWAEVLARAARPPVAEVRRPNRYERGMGWVGGALLAVGLIVVLAGRQAVRSAEFVSQLSGSDGGVGAAEAGFWFGVVLAVVGGLLLFALVVIRAARPSR